MIRSIIYFIYFVKYFEVSRSMIKKENENPSEQVERSVRDRGVAQHCATLGASIAILRIRRRW